MLSDIYAFLIEMLQGDPHVLAAFIMGIVVTAGGIFAAYWLFIRGRIVPDAAALQFQLDHSRHTSAALTSMVAERDTKIHQLSQDCVTLKEQVADIDAQLTETTAQLGKVKKAGRRLRRKAIRVRDRYRQQINVILEQLKQMELLQGKFWQQPPKAPVPAFSSCADGGAPIISTFNLKGGVGKTSLTAHLAAALWSAGKKVLLVDLDYQASLTHLVLSPEQVKDVHHAGKYVQRLLKTEGDPAHETWNLLTPIANTNSYLLAAHESLSDAEEEMKARWLMGTSKREPRYALRAALHSEAVRGKFDYILIDCPPRLSTACVNALTASDFLLVPTQFDKTSRDAVGRLCDLMRHFVDGALCPDLRILGIVGNMSYKTPSLTANEKTAWDQIKRDAKDNWKSAVYQFKRHLPGIKAFADASETRKLADQSPQLGQLFAELSREMIKELEKTLSKSQTPTRAVATPI